MPKTPTPLGAPLVSPAQHNNLFYDFEGFF